MNTIGRYVIISELGRGAMGIVYKASDPTIDREVALKVVSLNAAPDSNGESARQMFMREVRAAGRLSHSSIVIIHDAFDDPETQTSCIVMEMVPGRTLEKILEAGHALTIEQILNLVRQVAEGLDFAHRNQVIHRDLKPANILVTEDGVAKITDFGIAKVLAREGAARTLGVVGTPSYMSPEQVKGTDVDARTDIFSLGIMLFTMLSGKRPFAGNTATVMFKIVYEEPPAPSTLNPQLTPEFDYVVKRCLAKDLKSRYPTARELVGDLDDLQNGRGPRSQTGIGSSTTLGSASSTDRTVPMTILGTVKSAPPGPPSRSVAVPPAKGAPPPIPPAGHPESGADLPATMALPISELLKGTSRVAGTRPAAATPPPPTIPPQPPKSDAAPIRATTQSGLPLGGQTLPMHVPDFSAAGTPGPPSRQTASRPTATDSPLMERTLPMRVPDLSAISLRAPSVPGPTPEPMASPDLSTLSSPAPTQPGSTPASTAPVQPPAMDKTRPVRAPDAAPATPGPRPMEPIVSFPQEVPRPPAPAPAPVAALPASKSKLLPVIIGGVAAVVLAAATWGVWRFRRPSAIPPPAPVAAQTQTQAVPPPPLPTPDTSATPTPAPPAVEHPETPARAVSPSPRRVLVRKTKQVAAAQPPPPAPAPPQPQPVVATPSPAPAAPAPSPEAIAKAEAAKFASVPHIVQVSCNYGLKEAMITFSSGGTTLFEEAIKGKKKKGGFLGIKGSYEGTFTQTLTVPAGHSDVSVHVVAKDGADLTKVIKIPPGGFIPTLIVNVDNEHLSLNWKGSSASF